MSQEPSQTQDVPSEDDGPLTVRDDQLPDDLQPSDDNPLAQPAGHDAPDDLLRQEAERASSGGGSEDAVSGGDDDASGTSSSAASSETANPDDSSSR